MLSRQNRLCILAVATFVFSVTFARMVPGKPDQSPEVVFRWKADRCTDSMYPDAPARALRGKSSRIYLFAPHFENIPMVGADFKTLKPDCSSGVQGGENADPAKFDDRFWIEALAVSRSGLLALASHEYDGRRHSRCNAENAGSCWYGSIVALEANGDDPGKLRLYPLYERVIAASPKPYSDTLRHKTGFFALTNTVKVGDFDYALVHTEGIDGQPSGSCTIRAPVSDLVNGWRALRNGRFVSDLRPGSGLYPSTGPLCDAVGASVFLGPVRSIAYVSSRAEWIAVFMSDVILKEKPGVYFSLSKDLRNWEPAKLLLSVTPFRGQPSPGIYYQYPSIIDEETTDPQFGVLEHSVGLSLFLTRLNLYPDRRQGGNRDLVRFKVSLADFSL